MVHNLLWRCDMPKCQRSLAAVPDCGGENSIRRNSKLYGWKLFILLDKRNGQRRFHRVFARGTSREDVKGTEHVFVSLHEWWELGVEGGGRSGRAYLIITSAEDTLGIWVLVKQTLYYLSLMI